MAIKLTTEPIDPRHLLVYVARILDKFNIPYAVTGGMAVFVWGKPRFTADIDIVVQLKLKDIDRLARALASLSEASYIDKEMMLWALERKGEFNFIDGASGIKVDFWTLGNSPFERSQLARRIGRKILGEKVFFVSPEDLILSKLRWYKEGESARQLEDIESILKIRKRIDKKYLLRWARTHGTDDTLEPLWKRWPIRSARM